MTKRKSYFNKAAGTWDERFSTPALTSFLENLVPKFDLKPGQNILKMIKPIILYGNEILRKRSVDYKVGARLKSFIQDMWDTMENAAGAGLAAPQIGVNKRLFVIYLGNDFEKVFINPVIHEETGDWMVMEEGCLSLPDLGGNVIRKNN